MDMFTTLALSLQMSSMAHYTAPPSEGWEVRSASATTFHQVHLHYLCIRKLRVVVSANFVCSCLSDQPSCYHQISEVSTAVPPSSGNRNPNERRSPSDVYARILGAQKIGYPLWFPEPFGGPRGYETKGVSIGDLGFITSDGRFQFIFNIYLARDDPSGINRNAPLGFEPLIFRQELESAPYPCHRPGDRILSQRIIPELGDIHRWWCSYMPICLRRWIEDNNRRWYLYVLKYFSSLILDCQSSFHLFPHRRSGPHSARWRYPGKPSLSSRNLRICTKSRCRLVQTCP
jgi:hypothetical protein